MDKLKPDILRKSEPTQEELAKLKRNPMYLILDEVLDTYNIGSLFRLADAIGAEKMYLCGNMEYPPSSRIHKSAVGTENWVPWEKRATALEVVEELASQGVEIVAVEQNEKSLSWKNYQPNFPVALIVGNETRGVSQAVLDRVTTIVEFPMYGINTSFNVWGSMAIVAYKILETLDEN